VDAFDIAYWVVRIIIWVIEARADGVFDNGYSGLPKKQRDDPAAVRANRWLRDEKDNG
jgi:hypothetical protein